VGRIIIVMGVSGSGKSTLGEALSKTLNVPFIEGDDYHSQKNIEKMQKEIPLTDRDRIPWLNRISKELEKQQEIGAVLACSALKETYRSRLIHLLKTPPFWVYLKCEKALLESRIKKRKHFMPLGLLQSQFDTLEEPKEALWLKGNLPVLEMVEQIKKQWHGK